MRTLWWRRDTLLLDHPRDAAEGAHRSKSQQDDQLKRWRARKATITPRSGRHSKLQRALSVHYVQRPGTDRRPSWRMSNPLETSSFESDPSSATLLELQEPLCSR